MRVQLFDHDVPCGTIVLVDGKAKFRDVAPEVERWLSQGVGTDTEPVFPRDGPAFIKALPAFLSRTGVYSGKVEK